MSEQKDIRLIIEIQNKRPIELLDLTRSFISLAVQFNNYASEFGNSKENREAKLYVKEIRSGSVIVELIEIATIGVLPFLENINTIVGFADQLKSAYNYLLGKQKEKPKDFTSSDYKDLSQIISPIAKDNGSMLNISTTINGDVHFHYNINSLEANAAQNIIDNANKTLKEPTPDSDVKKKMLLTLFQTRSDVKSRTGNQGVIEDISSRRINLIFDDELLNEKMLHGEFNPLESIYVVDVLLLHAGGKLVAYKVLKLHEVFKRSED